MFKLVVLFFVPLSIIFPTNPWEFEQESEGIKAYSRLKANTSYYEFKTVTEMNSSAKRIVNILTDIDGFENWLTNTTKSKVLEKQASNVWIGYTVTSTPWPLSSRDLVFKMEQVKINSNTFRLILTGMPDYIPLESDYVRLKDYEAEWIISETNGVTTIEHIASFDPDSSTPAWMVKNSMVSARIEVLAALQEKLN